MGVHGLWRLIEPSGKPVPLETLENKVLAVDVSIWLHQAIKGFQDSRGAPIPNAHLLGIYHRICKLLYFKIKPVFVFDGGVPALKKETIAKRNQSRSKVLSEAERIQKQLVDTLLKHTALNKVLAEKIEAAASTSEVKPGKSSKFDMYMLPESSEIESSFSTLDEDSFESTEDTSESSPVKHLDLHNIDMESVNFKSLPADVRHEILSDLKETRKQSSWGRLHELPKHSNDFAIYQMRRLLKRQAVQVALEAAEKEMGGRTLSLAELEVILTDQGVIAKENVGNRIASDENKRFLYIKDLQQTIIEKKSEEGLKLKKELAGSNLNDAVTTTDEVTSSTVDDNKPKTIADREFEEDLEKAITLSLQDSNVSENFSNSEKASDMPSTSKESDNSDDENLQTAIEMSLKATTSDLDNKNKNKFSFLADMTGVDFESSSSEDEVEELEKKVESAKNYMMEYSGLTPNEIAKIINLNNSKKITEKPKENVECSTTTKDRLNESEKEFEEVEVMSTSSSECNDFLEITSTNECDKKGLEIIVNVEQEIEDDLFGDIFKAERKEEAPNNEENEVLKDISAEVQIQERKDEPLSNKESSTEPQITKNPEKVEEKSVGDQKKVSAEPKPKLTIEELQEMKKELQREKDDLLFERSTKERMAGNITDQMMQEAQELLELFGVPYVVAPMEAEAQCAFLDKTDLTNGTITDDSDVWLFGGTTVYKNFFNQSKYVMEFRAENIRHHFKLSREQMILLALLVGSDYTNGIQGIGPVTALEILAAFPPAKVNEFSLSHAELLTGLQEFRSWFAKGKAPGPGRTSLRSKLKNVSFVDNFPSLKVVQAYLEPTVETSKEEFSWGKPDVPGLIHFAKEKFGWTRKKSEEILTPVLNRLADGKIQRTIKDFFKTTYTADAGLSDKAMSKRVKTAIENMGKDPSEIIAQDVTNELKPKRSRKQKSESSSNKPKAVTKQKRKKAVAKEENAEEQIEDPSERAPKVQKRETSKNIEPETPSTSKNTTVEEPDTSNDVLDKIQRIRTRRRINTAKAKIMEKEKLNEIEKKTKEKPCNLSKEELFLSQLTSDSQKRVDEIETEVRNEIIRNSSKTETSSGYFRTVRKDFIHQKEQNKSELLRNKMKAIEVFRKSKKGPGFVGKRNLRKRLPKEDACLSESSSDE